jgi:hypothetical protein
MSFTAKVENATTLILLKGIRMAAVRGVNNPEAATANAAAL